MAAGPRRDRLRCLRADALVVAVGVAVTLGACQGERRDFSPPNERRVVARDAPAFRDPGRGLLGLMNPYPGNAWAVAEGGRLYEWFNCVGCHAHGGGAMGPPLTAARRMIGGGSRARSSR